MFCSFVCKGKYEREQYERAHPRVIIVPGSGSGTDSESFTDTVIDVLAQRKAAKEAKQEAIKAEERRRHEEWRASPEGQRIIKEREAEERERNSRTTKEPWLDEIDQLADKAIKNFEEENGPRLGKKDAYLPVFEVFVEKVNLFKDEYKLKIEKEWAILESESTSRNGRLDANYKIKTAVINFKSKVRSLSYKAYKEVAWPNEKKANFLTFLTILFSVMGIILGIWSGIAIFTLFGFLMGGMFAFIANDAHFPDGSWEPIVPFVLAAIPFSLILGIIYGVRLHGFLPGLIVAVLTFLFYLVCDKIVKFRHNRRNKK
jgi:hypothetical protein